MYLSFPDIFDLLLRFLTVGQLSLLSLYILSKRRDIKAVLGSGVAIGLSAYLLLTTPVPDQHYGPLRGILLFFTEITPYLLWCFAFALFKDDFHPKNWPSWIKTVVAGALLWFLYFFGYLQGRGLFHQINHTLELALLLHIIFIAVKDLNDDLVNARRHIRILLTLAISLYLSFILLLELGDASLRASSLFSVTNAALMLLATSVFSWYFFHDKFKDITAATEQELKPIVKPVVKPEIQPLPKTTAETKTDQQKIAVKSDIPPEYQAIHQQLSRLMANGFYSQFQLTIKALAAELKTPEHQLRKLINQHLGFRNFSDFLNSYRLPAACTQLEDITNIRKPILTLALELGYGSVATFNRAFKVKTGRSPKEYRDHFQK